MPATQPGQAPRRRRYTDEAIRERARIVQLAIEARRGHRPDEVPCTYAPGESTAGKVVGDAARREALRGYREDTILL